MVMIFFKYFIFNTDFNGLNNYLKIIPSLMKPADQDPYCFSFLC